MGNLAEGGGSSVPQDQGSADDVNNLRLLEDLAHDPRIGELVGSARHQRSFVNLAIGSCENAVDEEYSSRSLAASKAVADMTDMRRLGIGEVLADEVRPLYAGLEERLKDEKLLDVLREGIRDNLDLAGEGPESGAEQALRAAIKDVINAQELGIDLGSEINMAAGERIEDGTFKKVLEDALSRFLERDSVGITRYISTIPSVLAAANRLQITLDPDLMEAVSGVLNADENQEALRSRVDNEVSASPLTITSRLQFFADLKGAARE